MLIRKSMPWIQRPCSAIGRAIQQLRERKVETNPVGEASSKERHILPLDAKDATLGMVGGKASSLARMVNAGLPVPGGFYLTTAAYKGFVAENDLQAAIIDLARPEITGNTVSFESASKRIQDVISKPELSEALEAQIRQAYRALDGDGPAVAVRSSANAEDLPDMSFAGQQDTYLNVRGDDALIAAVRDCWASLWTSRAISYRHQMGIEQDAVAMAVVVQVMVPSDVSGILFTANPATGERSEIIINASFGLGEAVVGGQVTPDTYIVDRKSLMSKETVIGAKEQKIVPDGDQGTRLEETAKRERGQSSLSEKAIKELASMALDVERLFAGIPQDIEWAISNGKLWMLQSRPITSLPPHPIEVSWDPPPPARILVRRQIVENMPDPVCPLFEELYLTVGLHLELPGGSADSEAWKERMDGPLNVTVNGYAYQRMDWKGASFAGVAYKPGQKEPTAKEKKTLKAYRQKLKVTQGPMAKHDMDLFLASLSPADLEAFNDMAKGQDAEDLPRQLTLPESESNTFIAHNRTEPCDQLMRDWEERAKPGLLATIAEWQKVEPDTASSEQLLAGIRELALAEGRYWSGRNGGRIFGVIKSSDDQLQQFLLENTPDHHFTSGQFLSGFQSRTMQANEDMWEISKLVRASHALRELVLATPARRLKRVLESHPVSGPVLRAIHAYLDTYGHQGYSLDFVEPPPIEEPAPLFATLKTMVQDPDYDPKKHDIEATRKREAAFKKIKLVLHGLAYWQFRYRVWYAQRYYPYREEILFLLGSAWPVLRTLAAELGRRLVDVGTFALADDVYYLVMAELTECVETLGRGESRQAHGQTAAERRQLREARKRLNPPGTIPPEISGAPGLKESHTANDPASDRLKGTPVSPGSVTDPASLINSPDEFDKMAPNSIIVCPITTPAWTQLFAHATGLVTDIGGILGHGSIVAREYGIPAVVGTGIGTQRINHGQAISVDGDAGIVTLSALSDVDP